MESGQDKLEEILAEALAKSHPKARGDYLDKACAGDQLLRAKVDALIQAYEKGGAAVEKTLVVTPALNQERPGTVIGRYKLLQEIGEGGFGLVFLAEQLEPVRRKVALKIIKAGMDTREVIARFEAERQALALMDHPNIARVLDAGATESGRPYFVMELVKGVKVTDYCDQHNLSTEERLGLFIKVCHAVQHAHQKGIIHRDLKPSNVMVTVLDGEAVPKVIDFGIAKATGQQLTDKTLFTRYEQMIGTPAYMSPEQAAMSGADIDTRTDIYALGVLLYELLTGVTPFDKETLAKAALEEVRRMIRETDPPKPSTRLHTMGEKLTEVAKHRHAEPGPLRRSVRGDLDWIVMKALEKDRNRRYGTADDLAEDVVRHLEHQPVLAGPPRAAYRASKFVRRHRVGVVVGASVTVALVAGLSLALLGLQRALKAERLTRWEAYASDMKAAQVSLQQNNREMALNLLRRYLPQKGEEDLRGLEWQYLWQESRADDHQNFPHPTRVHNVALSPDAHNLVTACHDGKIRVWDVASARVIQEFDTLGFKTTDPITVRKDVTFSPDGTRLAIFGPNGVQVRETSGWKVIKELTASTAPVAFCASGRYLVTGGARGLQIWDPSDWSCRVLTNARVTGNGFALAPDAARLACAYYEIDEQAAMAQARVEVWDVRTGVKRVIEGTSDVFSLAISLDGRWLAYGTRLGEVGIWDLSAWSLVQKFTPHPGMVHGLAFSPDGNRLATGGIDQQIRVWETGTTNLLGTCTGHLNYIWSLEFSRNGLQLASSSMDGTAKLWSASPGSSSSRAFAIPAGCEVKGLLAERTGVLTIDYSAGNLQIWGLPLGQSVGTIPLNRLGLEGQTVSTVCNSPGGQALVTVTTNGLVCFFHLSSGALVRSVQVAATNLEIYSVSPDQRWVLGYLPDKSGLVCDLRNPSRALRIADYNRANSAAGFSTDSRLLAYSTTNHHVILWDLAANRQRALLKGPRWWIISVALSPNGKWVASGGDDGEVWLWSADTGRPLFDGPLKGHMGVISIAMFSSDSRILATYGRDRTMRWWNVATGREMLSFSSEPIYDSSVLDFPAPAGAPGRFLLFFERPGRIRATTVPSLAEIDVIEKGRRDSL